MLANNVEYKVVRIDKVKIKMFDGSVKTFGKVINVPEIERNLMFLGKQDSLRHGYFVRGGIMKVIKGKLVVLKGKKTFKNFIGGFMRELFKVYRLVEQMAKKNSLVRTPHRKYNNGWKKVKFVENLIDMVVKPI